MTGLLGRTRALIGRTIGLERVETVGNGIRITDATLLEVIVEAARQEGRDDLAAEEAFIVPMVSPESLEEIKKLMRQGGGVVIGHLVPEWEKLKADAAHVVMPWNRTALAQVRDLQVANSRYQQEARDARAETQALAERLLAVDPNAPGRPDSAATVAYREQLAQEAADMAALEAEAAGQ